MVWLLWILSKDSVSESLLSIRKIFVESYFYSCYLLIQLLNINFIRHHSLIGKPYQKFLLPAIENFSRWDYIIISAEIGLAYQYPQQLIWYLTYSKCSVVLLKEWQALYFVHFQVHNLTVNILNTQAYSRPSWPIQMCQRQVAYV